MTTTARERLLAMRAELEALAETGATSKREMGRVIGTIKKRPDASLIDFGAVSKALQGKLA